MKFYVRGKRTEGSSLETFSGPYSDGGMANHDAITFRLKGYFDVFVAKGAPVRRRLSDGRRKDTSRHSRR